MTKLWNGHKLKHPERKRNIKMSPPTTMWVGAGVGAGEVT